MPAARGAQRTRQGLARITYAGEILQALAVIVASRAAQPIDAGMTGARPLRVGRAALRRHAFGLEARISYRALAHLDAARLAQACGAGIAAALRRGAFRGAP